MNRKHIAVRKIFFFKKAKTKQFHHCDPTNGVHFPFLSFYNPLISLSFSLPFLLLLLPFPSESYLSAVSEITQFGGEVRGEDFGRGGRGEGHLQISSINHCTHSNVTNILQLEETRRSSPPSISLTPHDHRFISPCLKANTHSLSI